MIVISNSSFILFPFRAIQRLYAMLRGEELNEDIDEKSGFELAAADQRQRDVQYAAIPIETFDFIIADECHRSIYNLWRQVLEYFDAPHRPHRHAGQTSHRLL